MYRTLRDLHKTLSIGLVCSNRFLLVPRLDLREISFD